MDILIIDKIIDNCKDEGTYVSQKEDQDFEVWEICFIDEDKEFKHLKQNLMRFRDKYKNFVTVSFIFDKNMITGYKSSPIDEGPEKFLKLFKERIVL